MNTRRNYRNYRNQRNQCNQRVRGGVAPYPSGMTLKMYQPSESVMKWSTTADASTPSAAEMRNVAHGGKRSHKRSSHRKRSHRHSRSCSHKKRSHKRGHKRS